MSLALVVDGTNLAYRAKYTYQLSYRGEDTSVLYGVVRMLQSLISRYHPNYVVIGWDGGTPRFRRELVPSYKDNRHKEHDPTYPIFISQLKELEQILPYFGVLQARRRCVEADDFVYHASKAITADKVLIVSNDDDLYQAIDNRISVLKSGKKDYVEIGESDTPVHPAQFVMWKVLQGDKSDNVPGVAGVGPKTSTKLIYARHSVTSKSLLMRVLEFEQSGKYNASYACIDLSVDRSGAKYILSNIPYIGFSNSACTNWCLKRGFISILEAGSLSMTFGRLRKPVFDFDKTPRIWSCVRSAE